MMFLLKGFSWQPAANFLLLLMFPVMLSDTLPFPSWLISAAVPSSAEMLLLLLDLFVRVSPVTFWLRMDLLPDILIRNNLTSDTFTS